MKNIIFNNILDPKTKKLVSICLEDSFDEFSDSLAKASARGKLMGKRVKKAFRNKPVRSTG